MSRRAPTDDKGNKLKPELTLDPAKAPARRRNKAGWLELTTQVRDYELITPLMGGGVKAGYADLESPIHVKAIRGHLRFWWRATRGGQYPTITQLRESEINLWGAASTPKVAHDSLIQLQIKVTSKGNNFVHPPD
jgi:CRISPR-associated protein Cmr1